MTLIEINHLSKSYAMGHQTVKVLSDVTLRVNANAFLVLLGPSGSGKSTLLNLIGGLDQPSSGCIRIAGHELQQMDENALAKYRSRMMGFVFQSFNLVPSMSALENVLLPMVLARLPRSARRSQAMQLLRKVGLQTHTGHKPSELSGGQQQRVAIARALANDPKIILADEPTGNLDTQSGGKVMDILCALHREGKTVLVVTHDLRLSEFATQVITILDGHIADESATVHSAHPQPPFGEVI